jgi:hypothetical protein
MARIAADVMALREARVEIEILAEINHRRRRSDAFYRRRLQGHCLEQSLRLLPQRVTLRQREWP